MTSEFYLGATTSACDFFPLDQLLSNRGIPIDPDWSFQEFSLSVRAGDGRLIGQGFPIVKWRWAHLSDAHRDTLKALCSGLSAVVYIRTATNELDIYGANEFKIFQCVMNWMDTDEDKQIDQTIGVIVTFTHCVETEA